MHILDLPPEIIDIILYYTILSRNLSWASHLKLICNEFNHGSRFRQWHARKHHGADVLWHDYLVFRCRHSRDESVPCYVELRSLVDAVIQYCRTQGDYQVDFDEILDEFCWLVLHYGGKFSFEGWNGSDRRNRGSTNPGLNLLSAATYFGYAPLVRDLLSQGHDPTKDDDLFPSAMYLAAWTGRVDMIQLLQEHLPEFEDSRPDWISGGWRSKIGPTSLIGAASRGDLEMVQLSLYPPSRIIPSSTDNNDTDKENGKEETLAKSVLVWGEKPGSVAANSKLGCYILHGMRRARSPEVYQYLQGFLNLTDEELKSQRNDHLALMAWNGDIVMVRHLLAMGADPSDKNTAQGTALAHAVRTCRGDVVDLLLEHGADPNERGRYRRGTPLTAAAKTGSMAMLRKLLDAGAQPTRLTRHDTETLRSAISAENTAMVELLLDMGFMTAKGNSCALRMAHNMGLESMADLLESRGITLEGIPVTKRFDKWWP